MPSPTEGLRALRLLVVERSGWVARTLASVLYGTGWMLVRADDARTAVGTVVTSSPDVVLVHGDLGDANVVQFCARLRAIPRLGLVTPIIVLSAEATRSRRIAALRAGAWDFIAEPLDTEAFLLKLETFALSRREVERLEDATLVEDRTGLYNRAGLARRATEVAADTKRRHAPLSCVVFTPAGVTAGDLDAARIATTRAGVVFRRTGRASDVIARLGDTLAVIAPATDADGAQQLAARLQGAVRDTPAVDAGPGPLQVRAAYCAAADFSRSTLTIEEMLERATSVLARSRADDGPATVAGDIVPLEPAG